MKRIIIIVMLIIISAVSFFVIYHQVNYKNLYSMKNAELTENSCQISITCGNKSQEQAYSILKKLLDKYKGNIFFSRLDQISQKDRYTKYIYLSDTDYFKKFKLKWGDFLSLSQNESEKFLSTIDTNDIKQIGRLMDFAGDDIFEIRTLKYMVNAGLDGNAVIQFNNYNDIELFITELNNNNIYCKRQMLKSYSTESFKYLAGIAIIILYLIMGLLIFYGIIGAYKKIGALKMFGNDNKTIWLKVTLPIVFLQISIFTIVSIILIKILIVDYNEYFWIFISRLFIYGLAFLMLTFVSVSLPFLYLPKISISNMIKNKRPIEEILIMNTSLKLLFSVFLIISSFLVYKQYNVLFFKYSDSYKIFEATKDYAIIPSISNVSNDFLTSQEFGRTQKELYFYFNKKGSILADFYYYSPYVRNLMTKKNPERYKNDEIEVNPNYLKYNKVYDESLNVVNIDELDKNYILLIPEFYKTLESDIRKHYDYIKNGYSNKNDSIIPKQKVKIIWIKNDQKLFSYRIDINPNEGYVVKDPIIRVITEANGDNRDFDRIIGYGGNPFKIKVSDAKNPSASIRPILNKYGLSNKISSISTVFDYISAEIVDIKNTLMLYLMFIILFGTLIIFIIFQNIYNYFEQNKMRLAIKQFHGYKRRDRYNSYFLLIVTGWLFITCTSVLIYSGDIFQMIMICLTCCLLEIFISLLILGFVDKRKSIIVIKGG